MRGYAVLDEPLLTRVLTEAFALLWRRGVRVSAPAAVALLRGAGAGVDGEIVRLPEDLVRRAVATAPRAFALHDRAGTAAVRYGGDAVHFDPGSSALHVLDSATRTIRPAQEADLLRIIRVAEGLDAYAAQSTAVVCSEIPAHVSDLHRLYVVLRHSAKPIVTGAFSLPSTDVMLDLLAADAGGYAALAARPRAVFDVCPSPPLHWTEFAAQSLIVLARAGVPAEIIAMPLAGGTGPVTLAGVVTQHAAETLAGVVIHQVAQPGAPVVWGNAATIMDMRTGLAPVGAAETALLAAACAQVGQHFGLPTHAYLGATDAKLVDAQGGLESGMSALVGALAGINMISGAGMLDALAAFSVEKLALDAEIIQWVQRWARGISAQGETLALAAFAGAGADGRFLELDETRRLYRREHHRPSAVIERRSAGAWQVAGSRDAFERARARVAELEARYAPPALDADVARALDRIMASQGAPFNPQSA